jgi:MerR family transcriptional regulator, light-induced transcriptional regulator
LNDVPDSGLSAGEVARRIGVAVTTVRTWDRRYGLGPSARAPGRHRRYSRHDLARLMLMRRLTVDGVAAAEAARIARDTPDPHGCGSSWPRSQPPPSELGTAKGLRRAALALDPADLQQLLERALTDGVVRAWVTVIAPALRDLGRQHRAAGRYIAAEHLLSEAVSAALAQVPRPPERPRILLACAPEEQHSLPLEALAAALAERGISSRMLGARVPTNALRDAITRTGPTAVLLWAHTPAAADYQQLAAVTRARPRPAIAAACGPGWNPESLPEGVITLADIRQALAATAHLP